MDKMKGKINYDGPLEIEAYLRKMRIKNRDIKKEKTPLKFFKISLKDLKFCYKNHKSLNTWRMEIPLNEFIKFIPNLGTEHRGLCEFRYGFQLITRHKYFVLFCEEEMFNYDWVRLLEFIVNKKDLTYDNYEKFIVSQANKDYEAFFNENKNIIDENKEHEFSFSHHLIKEDGDFIEDSDMFYGNLPSNNNKNDDKEIKRNIFPKGNFDNPPESGIKHKENNNIYGSFQFQSFNNHDNFDSKNLNRNKNHNSLSKDEPVFVDTRKAKPIHDLNKYKIQKDQMMIQSSTPRNKIPNYPYNKPNITNPPRGDLIKGEKTNLTNSGRYDENDKKYLNDSRIKNDKTPSSENEARKENENFIDFLNEKDEVDDFLNFDFDQLNVSKSYRTKADKLIPIPIPNEPQSKMAEKNVNNIINKNNNLNNSRTSSKTKKSEQDYMFDPSKEFTIEDNKNLRNSLTNRRDSYTNLNDSSNNKIVQMKTDNKKSHTKNSNSDSNITDLNSQNTIKPKIPTNNQYFTPNPTNLNSYSNSNTQPQIPTPKSHNNLNSDSKTNLFPNTKPLNTFSNNLYNNNNSNSIQPNAYHPLIQPIHSTPRSQINTSQPIQYTSPINHNPFPTSNTYIPKKISANKSINNQDSINSQSSNNSKRLNNSQNSERIGNFTNLNNSNTNPQPGKKDPMYDYGHMHIKQDVKKETVNLENLHFGIDDYKKDIDNIPNPVIGSLQLNNLRKTGLREESVIMENIIKKKGSGLKKKLTPEDSLMVLRNIKKAPTNHNVILEESLKEEGNTWVLNVKIQKNEKI